MNSIDLSPLYRSTIGYDRLADLMNSVFNTETTSSGYPPYNIEVLDDNRYTITLAVAGFDHGELDIQVENDVLTIHGRKNQEDKREYLYHGIATRAFERKFHLADYVRVTGADLRNGLLTIGLVKEIPEEMKPRKIAIKSEGSVIEHGEDSHGNLTHEEKVPNEEKHHEQNGKAA